MFGTRGDLCAGQRVPSLEKEMKVPDGDCGGRVFVIKGNVEAGPGVIYGVAFR